MRTIAFTALLLLTVCATARAQYAQEEEPSLGEVARETRRQHQAAEEARKAAAAQREAAASVKSSVQSAPQSVPKSASKSAAIVTESPVNLKEVPLAVHSSSPKQSNVAKMLLKLNPTVSTETSVIEAKPIPVPVLHLPRGKHLPPIVQPALPGASTATADSVAYVVFSGTKASRPDAETNPESPMGTLSNPKIVDDDEAEYIAQARDLLRSERFAELDRMAASARTRKARIAGSVWQLTSFYKAVGWPRSGGDITKEEWQTHLARLQRWEKALPQSVTAIVALAQSYVNVARTTRETHWIEFANSGKLAKTELSKIPTLQDDCPHQYAVALQLAALDGWDKETASELFEEAFQNEPEYYPYYREYATYLLPRWRGQPGDVAQFANSILPRLPGQQGSIVYFEIGSVLACNCGDDNTLSDLSWEKIKEGYASLELLYGSSLEERNRYLFMAAHLKDKPAAQQVVEEVKANWNPAIWGVRSFFEQARAWATHGSDEGR
jgi:hypothetical protein